MEEAGKIAYNKAGDTCVREWEIFPPGEKRSGCVGLSACVMCTVEKFSSDFTLRFTLLYVLGQTRHSRWGFFVMEECGKLRFWTAI